LFPVSDAVDAKDDHHNYEDGHQHQQARQEGLRAQADASVVRVFPCRRRRLPLKVQRADTGGGKPCCHIVGRHDANVSGQSGAARRGRSMID
ncbi:MAG: hypothetical protein ACK559_12695, partial [bacterium]